LQKEAQDGINQQALAQFRAAKAAPNDSQVLFSFNDDFSALYPEEAKEIVRFNTTALGVASPAGEDLTQQNQELLRGAAESHPEMAVQTELVGYDYDAAFPTLIARLAPMGVLGFVLAALMGAVVSSLAAMLNAASTIFTMDLYKEYLNPNASQRLLVWIGRLCIPIAVVVGCLIAPMLSRPQFQGAFHFIQEFQGYISPGILTVFLFGLFVPVAPRVCGVVGLVLSPIVYGALALIPKDLTDWTPYLLNCFLNRMGITVLVLSVVLAGISFVRPLSDPIKLPEQSKISMETSGGAKLFGCVVVLATALLYVWFW
jgi:SSS family solute:Na+ symporter